MNSIRPSRTIVVRGDLYSDTGYGRATRAFCRVLHGLTEQLFVTSLHAHEERRQNALGHPSVSDAELTENPVFRDALVINLCLPNEFLRVSGAINVGYFFWETAALSRTAFWKAGLAMMDHLWAPSHWQSAFLRNVTGRADIPVVPWPLEAQTPLSGYDSASILEIEVHAPANADRLDTQRLGEKMDPSHRIAKLRDIRDGDLFLAIQTDAPRKGLPLLLSNWMAFKTSPEGRPASLLIKLSSIDVGVDFLQLHEWASRAIRQASERFGIERPDIWLMYDRLSPLEMRQLLTTADALVSATMGEGFGGPIAEALLEGTPVIVPRHTAIRELIDARYPLAVESTAFHLNLRGNLDVYSPSSPWHVVEDASFLDRLKAFARMSSATRTATAEDAKAALLGKAGIPAVAELLSRTLRCYLPLGLGPLERQSEA